jgi:hypothetical protein
MRLTKPQVFAGAALVSWACAKQNGQDIGSASYTPTGATGGSSTQSGTGGSSAPNGSGGSALVGPSAASGGTSAATGGAPGSGGDGSGGSPATGTGGSSPGAGHNGTGGTNPTAGRSGTGGTNALGGSGGDGSGGTVPVAGATSGGTGAAGVPNDPNWKPPDMTATAKLLVLYQPQQTAASSTNIQMMLSLKNQTDADYDLSNVTMRYWFSSEPPPELKVYYSSTTLNMSSTLEFVPNMANSYINFTFGKGGTVPAYVDQNSLNDAQISAGAQAGISNTNFNQANDWSFDATATAPKPNPKITIYDGDTLIWGCEPSHVCAAVESTGEAGGGGQPAM